MATSKSKKKAKKTTAKKTAARKRAGAAHVKRASAKRAVKSKPAKRAKKASTGPKLRPKPSAKQMEKAMADPRTISAMEKAVAGVAELRAKKAQAGQAKLAEYAQECMTEVKHKDAKIKRLEGKLAKAEERAKAKAKRARAASKPGKSSKKPTKKAELKKWHAKRAAKGLTSKKKVYQSVDEALKAKLRGSLIKGHAGTKRCKICGKAHSASVCWSHKYGLGGRSAKGYVAKRYGR